MDERQKKAADSAKKTRGIDEERARREIARRERESARPPSPFLGGRGWVPMRDQVMDRSSSESSERGRSREHKRKKRQDARVSKRKKGKFHDIKEFGNFEPIDQPREWNEWIETVYAALELSAEHSEREIYAWFILNCGQNLRKIISSRSLRPTETTRPFTTLVKNLERFFEQIADPVLERTMLFNCKQQQGESVNDFFMRLTRLMSDRYTDDDKRTHFISGLLDDEFKTAAITNGWSLQGSVAAAIRNEAAKRELAAARSARYVGPTVNATTFRSFGNSQRGSSGGKRQPCKECGMFKHRSGACPAIGKTCNGCKKSGHFVKVCPEKPRAKKGGQKSWGKVQQVTEDD